MEKLSMLITIIGVLVFVVSIITQIIKDVPGVKKIPTCIIVILLSIGLTVASFIAYAQTTAFVITWYWITASVIVGFIVAFVSMYGWDKLNDLWNRSKKEE